MVSDKKIALLGLDNAGKTSIITAMKQKFDIPNAIHGLKPTIKVERMSFQFLDHIIYLNDFGGQQLFMDEYLKHKVRYLSGIDFLFFVIDTQDSLRFDKALAFFDEILAFFEEISISPAIIVLLHKLDLGIENDPTILHNIENITTRVRKWQPRFQIKFMKSTIYDIQSVIRAFSKGISMLYSQNGSIQKFIDDFIDRVENVMAFLIFEQNGIELGSYFLEHITLNMKKKIITLYEIAQRRIIEDNRSTYEFSDRLDAYTKVSGTIQTFDIEGLKFYLLLVVEEHSEEDTITQFNYFEQAHNEIKEILSSILLDEDQVDQLNP